MGLIQSALIHPESVGTEYSGHPPGLRTRRMDWVWVPLPVLSLVYLLALPFNSSRAPGFLVLGTDLVGLPMIGFSFALLGLALNWVSRIGRKRDGRIFLATVAVPAIAASGVSTAMFIDSAGDSSAGIPWLPWVFVICLICVLAMATWNYRKIRLVRKTGGLKCTSIRDKWLNFCTLTKAGLNGLVLVAVFVGFYAASHDRLDFWLCLRTMAGTAMVAMGASVFNQLIEYRADGRMSRTEKRPLLTGRITPLSAALSGTMFSGMGLLMLCLTVNLVSGFLAAISLAIYLFLYTPLKKISTINTLAGAISGALPPVIGWVAACGRIEPGAIALFFILFLWQIPHFLAIGWKYREEYCQAGFCMYSVLDSRGRPTALQALLYTCLLLPVSITPFIYGFAGGSYLVSAIILGACFIMICLRFLFRADAWTAHVLFMSSIIYLPLLLSALVLNIAPAS